VFVRRDGLSGIVVADQEYPPRVAFALLNKLIEDFDKEKGCVPPSASLLSPYCSLLRLTGVNAVWMCQRELEDVLRHAAGVRAAVDGYHRVPGPVQG
jgi:hypothetical protein